MLLKTKSETALVRVFKSLTVMALLTPSLMPLGAEAGELEIIRQKGCTFLVSRAPELKKGDTVSAETASGKSVNLKVLSIKKRNAIVSITPKPSRCPSISGVFTLSDSGSSSRSAASGKRRFMFGISGNGGLYTFKQPFQPSAPTNQNGDPLEQAPQIIDGLSGLGFSGGLLGRFKLNNTFGLDLGASFLSSSPAGKTQLSNSDQYIVTAQFSEIVFQPSLTITRCISARLRCRGGGVVAIPLSGKLNIKSSEVDLLSQVKYTRFGGEGEVGLNLGKYFSIVGGMQISMVKGSFQFPENDVVNLSPLTTYIFAGLSAVF